jgi:hypothetical protein
MDQETIHIARRVEQLKVQLRNLELDIQAFHNQYFVLKSIGTHIQEYGT